MIRCTACKTEIELRTVAGKPGRSYWRHVLDVHCRRPAPPLLPMFRAQ